MEVHIQEGSNSSTDQPENFNDVGWASFPEINEKELVRRVSHCYGCYLIRWLSYIKLFLLSVTVS